MILRCKKEIIMVCSLQQPADMAQSSNLRQGSHSGFNDMRTKLLCPPTESVRTSRSLDFVFRNIFNLSVSSVREGQIKLKSENLSWLFEGHGPWGIYCVSIQCYQFYYHLINPRNVKYYIFLRRQRQRRRWRRRWWRRWRRRRRKELLKINISKILDVITSFFLKLIWVFSWTSLHRNADPSFRVLPILSIQSTFQVQQLPQTFRRRCWNRDYYNDIRHLSWNFLSFELREANSFWSP